VEVAEDRLGSREAGDGFLKGLCKRPQRL